jgi:hypothetical protein
VALVDAAVAPVDAAPGPGADGGGPHEGSGEGPRDGGAAPATPARDPEADKRKLRELLAAAKEARAADRSIPQIAYAQRALEVAPRNREALFLLGEALLRSGDLDRGCRVMKKVETMAEAAELLAKRGCK